MEFKDYYKILGVRDTADEKEIKASYRRLARKYHPDVSKERDAENRFKELGEAYEVLKDPEKRARYDQLRTQGTRQPDGGFRPPPGWQSAGESYEGSFTGDDARQFSDFFESLFGRPRTAQGGFRSGGGAGGLRMRGQDIHHTISLFLEEAYRGCEHQIRLLIPEIDESGLVSHREKTLNIKIPPGVTPGQRIRLAGQGAPGIGGAGAGDLFLEVQFAPHPYFSVDGRNIILTLPVASWEAALGATVEVPTLGGKVKLKIPRGSSSGDRLRIKGKGLSGKPAGDQLVVLKVTLPQHHSAAAESLYRQIAAQESAFNPRAAWED
jgi:curved DNA-binding protein